MLRVMPQEWKPKDWAEEQARRVASEVNRLRGDNSTQWLSDRTQDAGYRVSRSVIADLENGRRRYVTAAELIMLAVALDTTPIALLYPGPDYMENIQVMPDMILPKIWALQWFSGLIQSISEVPFAEDAQFVQMPNADEYHKNIRGLNIARQMADLDEQRKEHLRDLGRARNLKEKGIRDVPDEEISGLVAMIEDYNRRINDLRDTASRPPATGIIQAEELAAKIRQRRAGEEGAQDGG
jgi:hypothetical protein